MNHSYYKDTFVDGVYQQVKVTETVEIELTAEQTENEYVLITHIGPNGLVKFIYNGVIFSCYHSSAYAVSLDKTICILTAKLTFMYGKFKTIGALWTHYNKTRGRELWIEVPLD